MIKQNRNPSGILLDKMEDDRKREEFIRDNPSPTKMDHCSKHNVDYGRWEVRGGVYDFFSGKSKELRWENVVDCPKCVEESRQKEIEQERKLEIKKRIQDLGIPPRFEGVGRSSEYLETYGKKDGILFTGAVGTGKTYQAIALAMELANISNVTFRLRTWSEICMKLRTDIDSYNELFKYYSDGVGALFIDDFGSGKPTEFISEFAYSLINYRYNWKLPMIITTNLGSKDITEQFGERTTSRLYEMLSVVKLTGKDRRIK